MRWIADASTVVAYLLGESTDSERSVMLGDVHAPTLVNVEVTQTLRGLLRAAKIDLARAEQARDELTQLGLTRHPDASLLRRAWELRDVCSTTTPCTWRWPRRWTACSSPGTGRSRGGSTESSR